MQAMILAVGMGKRLGKYTKDQTKCMVEVNGKTLIEHALDKLKAVGVTRIILVIGYRHHVLFQTLLITKVRKCRNVFTFPPHIWGVKN